MRRIFTVLAAVFAVAAHAQQIQVSSLTAAEMPAGKEVARSINDEPCALVRLHFAAKGVKVEGNLIKMEVTGADVYDVWLTPRTKMMRVKAEEKYPLMIRFADHGVPALEGGKAYDLTLSSHEAQSQRRELREEIDDPLVQPDLGALAVDVSVRNVDKNVADRMDHALGYGKADNKERFALAQEASAKGYYKGTKHLIYCYLYGSGCKKSSEMARKTAELLPAQTPAAYCDDMGDYLRDIGHGDLALQAYARGALMSATSACWSKLGEAFEKGIGTAADSRKAAEIYRYAARKQFSKEDEALAGLVRLGESVCSREAVETQRVNVAGLSPEQMREAVDQAMNYGQEQGRDYPQALALYKVLADNFGNRYAAAAVARAYDGLAYPVTDRALADKYASMARTAVRAEQRERVHKALASMGGSDTLHFSDYSQARVGDFFYSDGTLTHDADITADPVGMVYSLTTSPAEQAQGWTHGMIMSLYYAPDRYGVLRMDWADSNDRTTGKYFSTYKDAASDMDGYARATDMELQGGFTAADAAHGHEWALPQGATSGWRLPSMGDSHLMVTNLGGGRLNKDGDYEKATFPDAYPFLDAQEPYYVSFWTSTQMKDCKPAVVNSFRSRIYIYIHEERHTEYYQKPYVVRVPGHKVLPVAAF